ncbi:MAG: hypothetical protein WCJ58_07195, partial [bacterium]
ASFAQIITLVLILFINLVLFRISLLTEIFFSQIRYLEQNISIYDYWAVVNIVVVFFAFATTLNTTLDVVSAIIIKKKKYPSSTVSSLLMEGTKNSQIIGARIINNMFYVFVGMSLLYIVFNNPAKYSNLFDEPFITQNLILFLNAAVAALLIAPITALVTVIYLASLKEPAQIKFF